LGLLILLEHLEEQPLVDLNVGVALEKGFDLMPEVSPSVAFSAPLVDHRVSQTPGGEREVVRGDPREGERRGGAAVVELCVVGSAVESGFGRPRLGDRGADDAAAAAVVDRDDSLFPNHSSPPLLLLLLLLLPLLLLLWRATTFFVEDQFWRQRKRQRRKKEWERTQRAIIWAKADHMFASQVRTPLI